MGVVREFSQLKFLVEFAAGAIRGKVGGTAGGWPSSKKAGLIAARSETTKVKDVPESASPRLPFKPERRVTRMVSLGVKGVSGLKMTVSASCAQPAFPGWTPLSSH